ncbi:Phosphocarrier protein HPr [Aquisphaera giovannonii]|uniref:Phosphocarrier protein HPr n=1 Tax=Aquisphaera giovannonii TaxID=406548 RepID=A0A5B9VUW8_9BACT|nr:HPr family phosphocarrier protein [Aquisphaera giovannonii]QEH32276.1 Phosphocarrier protein HPr [Aquisphaera giovannonii]
MIDLERRPPIVFVEPRTSLIRLARVDESLGLHLRVAARFAAMARRFAAEVRVRLDGAEADGKSVLDLMCLGAACGAVLELEARGEDAEAALAALSAQLVAPPAEADGRPTD